MSHQLALARQQAIDQQAAHAAYVEQLAYHDVLTSLPNRRLFSDLLGQAILQARRRRTSLAVLFLDIDGFKQINDTLGHEAGDELLREIATRLRSTLRESDSVARFGGDEFVVLLPELTQDRYAAEVAGKVLATVARPLVLGDRELCVTTSVGISVYPIDGEDEETLTRCADVAMYQAKQEGKNRYRFHSDKPNAGPFESFSPGKRGTAPKVL
jgi:diguanylate cyclase (GGDEF)-like protein